MSGTGHVNETWLCSLPSSLQSLSLEDSLFTYFPACYLGRTNLTTLNLNAVNIATDYSSLSNLSLSSLTSLELYGAGTGSWPSSVFQMTNLKSLTMTYLVTGGIPFPGDDLSNLPNLETLVFDGNNFVGNVNPDLFETHANLKYLTLRENGLNGTFPTSNMENLVELDLSGTQFTHLLDPSPAATSLQKLILDSSTITNFPTRTGFLKMSNLATVSMYALDTITGGGGSTTQPGNAADDMPDFWATHPSLTYFSARGSGLNGTMPQSITPPNLVQLDLTGNNLRGNMATLVNAASLQLFHLRGNQVNGSLPSSYVAPMMRTLDWNGNKLSGTIPDNFIPKKRVMNSLSLANNLLTGTIPFALADAGFAHLDLSHNGFGGCLASYHISEATRSMGKNLLVQSNNLYGPLPDLSRLHSMTKIDFSDNGFDLCSSNPNLELADGASCQMTMSASSVASGEGSACNCESAYFSSLACYVDSTCPAPQAPSEEQVVPGNCAAAPTPFTLSSGFQSVRIASARRKLHLQLRWLVDFHWKHRPAKYHSPGRFFPRHFRQPLHLLLAHIFWIWKHRIRRRMCIPYWRTSSRHSDTSGD